MARRELTHHISIVARGNSDNGQRFCKLRVKGEMGVKTIVVRETNLQKHRDELEAIGANLVSRKAFSELEDRIQANGLTPPTFPVATRIEIREEGMALPGGPFPRTNKFAVVLTEVPREIQNKYQRAGSVKRWKKALSKVARGNSRVKLAFALPFVGPLSAVAPIEHVGVQLVGAPGSGKSSLGTASTSVWGWDPDPVQADKTGFGKSWHTTVNNLDDWLPGYNQTYAFLNETRLAGKNLKEAAETVLDAAMKIEGASGKGRMHHGETGRFFAPLLSSSNLSVQQLAELAGVDCDAALLDRLIDVPAPTDALDGMFENLHGFADAAAFSVELKRFAAENHGWPGLRFVESLLKARKQDQKALEEWINRRREFYIKAAKSEIQSDSRDLTRLHGKFATIYAAGALAVEYDILPFTRKALRLAILKCEKDHVAFVEQRGIVNPAPSAWDRLRSLLKEHRHELVNLEDAKRDGSEWGYSCHYKGVDEILLDNDRFEELVGGKKAATALKSSLAEKGFLATEAGNKGKVHYVARRGKGEKRDTFVAIDVKFLEV
jgi:hypothetical protein